jgi:hypothetical protein
VVPVPNLQCMTSLAMKWVKKVNGRSMRRQ